MEENPEAGEAGSSHKMTTAMFDPFRRVLYSPSVNWIVRTLMKPFRSILPQALKIPVSGVIAVDTEGWGKIRMATNQTNCLTKELFWGGGIRGYEYPSVRIFRDLVKTMSCFVDVGASIGYFSLIAARVKPDIRVYAFEPMPGAFFYLKRNVALNDFSNRIFPFDVAVADEEGTATFHVTRNPKALFLEHHIGGSSSLARAKDSFSEAIQVELVTVDQFVEREGIARVDIMKLDTEATEDAVLRGARRVIERDKPIILCEVLPGRIEDQLQALFQEYGYVAYLPTEHKLERVRTLAGHKQEKDFLLVHESKQGVVEAFVSTQDPHLGG